MTRANQPPSNSLTAQPATRAVSRHRKNSVAPIASGVGRCQALRTTKKVNTVVISIVSVTAMP